MSRTRIITVSASCGGAGKTLLIEALLPCLPNCAAIKVRRGHGDLSLLSEDDPRRSPGKDTSRFLAAGARRAFLVAGPIDEALDAVRDIINSGDFDVVVIESNSLSREIESDLAFFVKGPGDPKPDARVCEQRADVVVSDVRAP